MGVFHGIPQRIRWFMLDISDLKREITALSQRLGTAQDYL